MHRSCALAGIAVLVGLLAAPARAATIHADTLVATGGDVVVTFLSNGAGYSSDLMLDGSVGDQLGVIFNNWTSAPFASMNLGSFAKDAELVFKLFVHETGDVFYTGDASRNRDGIVHALMSLSSAPFVTVGFEDLLGGGDRDYNDLVFGFTNVLNAPAAVVDEPGNLLMLGTGLVMLVFAIRRQPIRR